MAAHSSGGESAAGATLPAVVPFDLATLTRLSWELGSRVLEDEKAQRHSAWTHRSTPWALSVHRVTSNTVVVRVTTPAQREQFYGAVESDVEAALAAVERAPDWRRAD